jgi:hypothetical protein
MAVFCKGRGVTYGTGCAMPCRCMRMSMDGGYLRGVAERIETVLEQCSYPARLCGVDAEAP